jgi:hypothetical protein
MMWLDQFDEREDGSIHQNPHAGTNQCPEYPHGADDGHAAAHRKGVEHLRDLERCQAVQACMRNQSYE